MTSSGEAPDLQALSYEEIVVKLEGVIEQMASGELGIEEVTDLYEQAGELHQAAEKRLERIRDRIDRLTDGAAAGPDG
ncbi:MAG: exodeoxyribonuclease VII small subunit [Acidimicrobiales bacterium]